MNICEKQCLDNTLSIWSHLQSKKDACNFIIFNLLLKLVNRRLLYTQIANVEGIGRCLYKTICNSRRENPVILGRILYSDVHYHAISISYIDIKLAFDHKEELFKPMNCLGS